jgi:hypothetical protein
MSGVVSAAGVSDRIREDLESEWKSICKHSIERYAKAFSSIQCFHGINREGGGGGVFSEYPS